ncbi:hypothetical protein ACX9R5_18660 [Rathayibacter sp. CAU 1779]
MVGEVSATQASAISVDDLVTLADLFPTLADEMPLDHLVSDAASRTWFGSTGFTIWSDISCMTLDEIEGWPGLGRQRVDQLIEDLARVAHTPVDETPAASPLVTLDEVSGSMTFGELFPFISPATLVESLVTGTRTRNAIGRRGLTTWAQLASLTLDEVRRWNGVGSETVKSLLQNLAAYEPDQGTADARDITERDPLNVRFPDLDPSIPLYRLTRDTRLLNALQGREISNWEQLSKLSVIQIAAWSGIGSTSIERLLADLASAPIPIPSEPAKTKDPGPSMREQSMIQMRREGAALGAIGERFGVSRERVRQIIGKYGGPSPAEVRARKAALALEAAELRRGEIDRLLRPVLMKRGALTVSEAAEAIGVTSEEIATYWPEDLGSLRIRPGSADRSWTEQDLLSAVREAALYEFPLTAKAYSELVRMGQVRGPSLPLVYQRFGSWAVVCDAAGVEHGQTPRASYNTRWTDEEIVAFARDYLLDADWPGSAQEYDNWKRATAPDAPSFMTIRNRLGTWSSIKRLALRPGEHANE